MEPPAPLTASRPLVTLAVCLTALALLTAPDSLAGLLQFDRPRTASGEVWRLLTCHAVHYTPAHALRDAIGFALLGWSLERESRPALLRSLTAALVAVPIVLWIAEPHLILYRGLSALDFALLGAVCAQNLRRSGKAALIAGAALVAAVAWIVWQWAHVVPPATLDADTFRPVPLAHLAGLLSGLAASLSTRPPRTGASAAQ